jgi:hypothetical protein
MWELDKSGISKFPAVAGHHEFEVKERQKTESKVEILY